MSEARELAPSELCKRCDPSRFEFTTTADLPDLDEVLGQPRATEAIRFGMGIRGPGFNLFALGEPGTGRRQVIETFLKERAGDEATPPDWCYVYNFGEPQKPNALELPAGCGGRLRDLMRQLVEDLEASIPSAFESEEYRARRKELEEQMQREHSRPFEKLGKRARKHGIALIHTPHGMALGPVKEGEVLSPDEFGKLADDEKKRIRGHLRELEGELEKIVHQVPRWQRHIRRRIQELDRDVTRDVVHALIEDLRREFNDLPDVQTYLDEVEKDIINNAADFRDDEEDGSLTLPGATRGRGRAVLRRYEVNVLVRHEPDSGAPVVYEDNPTFQNLMGAVEHIAQMGTLLTNFTLIKAGALHRANGGYLLVDVHKLLMQPFAWEGLKRALRSGSLRPESPGQAYSFISTVSLEPEPVALDVKVVLLGDRRLYYLLHYFDPEFGQLFKVAADFENTMPRDGDTGGRYARLIATLARREKLFPLDAEACARLVEEGARLASDAERVSIRWQELIDLMREADHWAREAGREVVTREDVQHGIDARVYRSDRIRQRLLEEIERNTILIDTSGERVGQVNGLSVNILGGFQFGHPSRITARVRLGKGELVDIQREVEMGGPIHSKGVLTLAGYLGQQYVPDLPQSLSASLVFEQAYGTVEGDSASAAELFALLSALSGTAIRQSLAVTGSVNQHGDIQAIGGVNEKIEGFYDVCRRRGLDGSHGVLIPAANIKHLMLRADVVAAVEKGEFHVWSYVSADEGLALLTGKDAGERGEDGSYPDGSVNALVEGRLMWMAEQSRAFAAGPSTDAPTDNGGATPPGSDDAPGNAP